MASAASLAVRPKRKLRHEALALAVALALPCAVIFAFPFRAAHFRPAAQSIGRETPSGRGFCAFVALDAAGEAAAMAKLVSMPSAKALPGGAMQLDLATPAFAAAPPRPAGSIADRAPPPPLPPPAVRFPALPPSLAAPEPPLPEVAESAADGSAEVGAATSSPPFPRDAMLAAPECLTPPPLRPATEREEKEKNGR